MLTREESATPTGELRADLLPRVARGDAGAVRACIDRYGALVWSLARRLSRSEAEAEDGVQDAFVDIWRSAGRFDPSVASETTFVALIARRRLIDRRRKFSRQLDQSPITEAIAEDVRGDGWRGAANGQSNVGMAEDVAEAARALDQLSLEQQKVLRLAIYRGISHDSISRVLNMPLGTVKTHARRGLIKLRELLGRANTLQGAVKGGTP